ncbi:hypothetical protein [Verminephrobacter eiseniae]|uniref:hypothetical protein n=1 Tax=Verminephrobacter eiseniae TaxID=364317 RepID=UPI0022372C24|nr:hypothetical protein [Verminephrobacter eiseniae]
MVNWLSADMGLDCHTLEGIELQCGLGLKRQMQFDIAECFVTHGQHPHGDLALITVGKRSHGFGIQLAATSEFNECQSVGHQVRTPQVVHP